MSRHFLAGTIACSLAWSFVVGCSSSSAGANTAAAGAGGGSGSAGASGAAGTAGSAGADGTGTTVACTMTFSGAVTASVGCVGSVIDGGGFELLGFQGWGTDDAFSAVGFNLAVTGTFSAKTYSSADFDPPPTHFGMVGMSTPGNWGCGSTSGLPACSAVTMTMTLSSIDPAPADGKSLLFGGTMPAQSMGKNTHGVIDATLPGVFGVDAKGVPISIANLVIHVVF